ncbi:spore coat associated protein CotJA [Halanaerobaculum tunisiense]
MPQHERRIERDYPLQYELAEAYIPFQEYNSIYNSQEALSKGTIFPELYKPYQRQR